MYLVTQYQSQKSTPLIYFFLCVLVVFTAAIYSFGMGGPFIFDDIPNIVENKSLNLKTFSLDNISDATTSIQPGLLGRPVSYFTFALNYYFFGSEPFSFKLVNLIIHLLNGVGIFITTSLLLRGHRLSYKIKQSKTSISWVAFSVAALWLLHPLALTSVLYVVQRMASLSTLFSLLAIILYLSGRLEQFVGRNGVVKMIFGLLVCIPLAILSKENAVLIPIFLILVEIWILRFRSKSKYFKPFFGILIAAVVVPLLALVLTIDPLLTWLMHSYDAKPFTIYERLMTETRVVWFYIKLVFLPTLNDLGLYHDDIPLSTKWLSPLSTVFSMLGLIALIFSALWLRTRTPILSFGIIFFLVGHSIESSVLSLEIAHEHRNYLPMFGLLLVTGYYGLHPNIMTKHLSIKVAGMAIIFAYYVAVTLIRSVTWNEHTTLAFSMAERHPDSARSNYEAGRILTNLIEQDSSNKQNHKFYSIAKRYFTRSYETAGGNPSGLFAILYLDSLMNKPENHSIFHKLEKHLREHPILPATATSFTSLHRCWAERRCLIDPGRLSKLYTSALLNQRMSNQSRASLLNELAIIELSRGNQHLALQLFSKSVETNPKQSQLWFNYIQVLINLGETDVAADQLGLAEKRFYNQNDLATMGRLANQIRNFSNKNTAKL